MSSGRSSLIVGVLPMANSGGRCAMKSSNSRDWGNWETSCHGSALSMRGANGLKQYSQPDTRAATDLARPRRLSVFRKPPPATVQSFTENNPWPTWRRGGFATRLPGAASFSSLVKVPRRVHVLNSEQLRPRRALALSSTPVLLCARGKHSPADSLSSHTRPCHRRGGIPVCHSVARRAASDRASGTPVCHFPARCANAQIGTAQNGTKWHTFPEIGRAP